MRCLPALGKEFQGLRSRLWMLIVPGVISVVVGGLAALLQVVVKIPPEGWWRGATGFWILATPSS